MVLSSNRHKIGGHVIVKLLVGLRSSFKFGHVVVVVCIPVYASGGGSGWTLLIEEAVLGEVLVAAVAGQSGYLLCGH